MDRRWIGEVDGCVTYVTRIQREGRGEGMELRCVGTFFLAGLGKGREGKARSRSGRLDGEIGGRWDEDVNVCLCMDDVVVDCGMSSGRTKRGRVGQRI